MASQQQPWLRGLVIGIFAAVILTSLLGCNSGAPAHIPLLREELPVTVAVGFYPSQRVRMQRGASEYMLDDVSQLNGVVKELRGDTLVVDVSSIIQSGEREVLTGRVRLVPSDQARILRAEEILPEHRGTSTRDMRYVGVGLIALVLFLVFLAHFD